MWSRTVIVFVISSSLAASGCTTCKTLKKQGVSRGEWTAEVKYRKCGSVSGYGLSLYQTPDGAPGHGKGGKEPFQAMLKTSDADGSMDHVKVNWQSDTTLVVRHETRMTIEDDKSKPMVMKAEEEYDGVSIIYSPEPVLWE